MDGVKSVGGEVIEQPRNERERWLMNTVATQARQAGIAMPQVAIYHAPDINAFATGARRDASLVAVSTGLLQNMSLTRRKPSLRMKSAILPMAIW